MRFQWRRRSLYAFFALLSAIGLLLYIIPDSNTVEDQAQRLGTREFTPATWAKATDLQRGEMTASLLKKHDVTSLHRTQIEALLGEPTGYFDYDTNPAYFVGPKTVESMYGKGYLLVFLANKTNGEIDSVIFFPEVE